MADGFTHPRWNLSSFPQKLRQKFMGHCQIRGKNPCIVLKHLINEYLHDEQKKEDALRDI